MYDFTKNKPSKQAISNRKPIYGVGINDAPYVTMPTVNGKRLKCVYYLRWINMLKRCYSDKYKATHISYNDCSTIKNWYYFMSFRSWMITQDWQGMDLDKDIKIKGNKIYSPDTCLFIPHALNTLLTNHAEKRGEYPQGVHFDNKKNKFIAQISDSNRSGSHHIGSYLTAELAEDAYLEARKSKILTLIANDIYPIATHYLEQHI